MAEFTVNPTRFDPYKNFKFRVKWDGKFIAGVSRVSGLKRTTGSTLLARKPANLLKEAAFKVLAYALNR